MTAWFTLLASIAVGAAMASPLLIPAVRRTLSQRHTFRAIALTGITLAAALISLTLVLRVYIAVSIALDYTLFALTTDASQARTAQIITESTIQSLIGPLSHGRCLVVDSATCPTAKQVSVPMWSLAPENVSILALIWGPTLVSMATSFAMGWWLTVPQKR